MGDGGSGTHPQRITNNAPRCTLRRMDGNLKVWVADEADPEIALFELATDELPRYGDVVGDILSDTFRVEKRVFLLGPEDAGVRKVKGIQLVCKRVIV